MTELKFAPLDINGVLKIIPPIAPAIPLVFDSPHSGLVLPDFERIVSDELVRYAADTYVEIGRAHV